MRIKTNPYLLWGKRIAIYILGLYLTAMGVVFSARSALGVSPVSSLGNVMYQIALAAHAPTFFNLGNCTTIVFCGYMLVELLILRRDFKPEMLLQILVSFLFGQLVNLAGAMLRALPAPSSYAVQLLYVIISIPLIALGIFLYLGPNLFAMPSDGLCVAVSKKAGISVGTAKTIFDCSVVAISTATSLLYFRALVGVREGTVIVALLVGTIGAEGYQTDLSGNPKVIITIGREFGSGGHDIAEKLAERLHIPFYDKQIDRLAAQQYGIPLAQMEKITQRLEREPQRIYADAAYAMTNALSPEEEIFVAQSKVIRQIAASGESCVILGRCADWLLYDDPNCFRIFVHARPDVRVKRTMAVYGLGEEEARRQVEATDRARAQYYERYTGREYGKQKYYHLGLDSGLLGTDESVESIINILRRWCDVRGTHPLYML